MNEKIIEFIKNLKPNTKRNIIIVILVEILTIIMTYNIWINDLKMLPLFMIAIILALLGGNKTYTRDRDKRRKFSPEQQKEILKRQDYRCAECHEKLNKTTTQYDHIKPWSKGGKTIPSNGQALCANYHSKKSHYEAKYNNKK